MDLADGIQPGWLVADSFGEEIGTVMEVSGPQMRVKMYGNGELMVPGSACALVETGRVELSMTKKELQSGAAASA